MKAHSRSVYMANVNMASSLHDLSSSTYVGDVLQGEQEGRAAHDGREDLAPVAVPLDEPRVLILDGCEHGLQAAHLKGVEQFYNIRTFLISTIYQLFYYLCIYF